MFQTNVAATATSPSLKITDITEEAARLPAFDNHETVWFGRDVQRGFTGIVAIHDTTLGPALGGTRIWPYDHWKHALTDVLRLSRGMTFKSAIAGLDLGGGKAVIMADSARDKNTALLTAYAEMLATLTDSYITAEDVGMTLADADFLHRLTPNVTGTSASGNPSPLTARGVFLGMEAAARFELGAANLRGLTVAVQGLGAVGYALCRMLHTAGASLVVADIAEDKVERARGEFGAEAVEGDAILSAKAHIFAPCALGAVLSRETIPQLRAPIVAGSANNVLAEGEDGAILKDRGILYAPDFVINAGGVINVAGELDPDGYNRSSVKEKIAAIPETLTTVFERSRREDRPTNAIALEMAMERIRAASRRSR